MKKYIVQTGWDYNTFKSPTFKGDVEVLAINSEVAKECMLQEYIHLCPVVKEVSAKDLQGTRLLPDTFIPYMGVMGFISN